MSKNGDVVWANEAVWQRDNQWEIGHKQWWIAPAIDGLDGQKTLKELKEYKDFDWIVFKGRRRFYTDSQVNQLIDQSEKLTEQINNQEQSIRSYQESLKYWGLKEFSADFDTLQNYSEGQKETILYYQNLVSEYRDQRDKAMVSRHAAETKSFGLQQRVDELIEQFEHLAVVNKENCEERDAAKTQADGAEQHVTELIAKKQVLTRERDAAINQAGVAEQHVARMIAEVNDLRRKVNEAGATMKLAQSIIDENNQLKQDINGILTNTADVKVKAYMSALDHVIEAVQEIKKDELNDPYYG